eukprot:TRINITY_DN7262_c0_g1_i3.p1 TRINITY_DN7262_c0_g1~~TRINITY_DN7262_c0_g1_i3.p1  ORF type:complete len:601 (+),score=159.97 TRINITY_DN7262_c0_g1_i3:55-1857(+)
MPWNTKISGTKKKDGVKLNFKTRNPFEEKKRKEEERRKRDQKEAAAVFAEFVADFAEPTTAAKTFVKGGADSNDKSSIYKADKLAAMAPKPNTGLTELFGDDGDEAPKPKKAKKKSNLEMFKEQLKKSQEERGARHAIKKAVAQSVDEGLIAPPDTLTTNIYISDMAGTMTEEKIAHVFGSYGPLASVKIMWPRGAGAREVGRSRLCGFVAFMQRRHAEKALEELTGKVVEDVELRIGWGKAVAIPPRPYFVMPETGMSAYTGLPFNAVPARTSYGAVAPPGGSMHADADDPVRSATITVHIPKDKTLRQLIHRTLEFVIREGAEFEALLISKVATDERFAFLYDYRSPEHVYYRWKLFSILNGEDLDRWRESRFRMYEGGPWWEPPKLDEANVKVDNSHLSTTDRDEFEGMLRNMTVERRDVGDTMYFCLMHAEASKEIVDCIEEAMSILATPPTLKVARLYLISDILHNSTAKVKHAAFYRNHFEERLPSIFKHLHATYKAISGRLRAEQFRKQILACLDVWRDWSIYSRDLMDSLHELFHHGVDKTDLSKAIPQSSGSGILGVNYAEDDDVDGVPLDDDADGVPMQEEDEDVDGVPL